MTFGNPNNDLDSAIKPAIPWSVEENTQSMFSGDVHCNTLET